MNSLNNFYNSIENGNDDSNFIENSITSIGVEIIEDPRFKGLPLKVKEEIFRLAVLTKGLIFALSKTDHKEEFFDFVKEIDDSEEFKVQRDELKILLDNSAINIQNLNFYDEFGFQILMLSKKHEPELINKIVVDLGSELDSLLFENFSSLDRENKNIKEIILASVLEQDNISNSTVFFLLDKKEQDEILKQVEDTLKIVSYYINSNPPDYKTAYSLLENVKGEDLSELIEENFLFFEEMAPEELLSLDSLKNNYKELLSIFLKEEYIKYNEDILLHLDLKEALQELNFENLYYHIRNTELFSKIIFENINNKQRIAVINDKSIRFLEESYIINNLDQLVIDANDNFNKTSAFLVSKYKDKDYALKKKKEIEDFHELLDFIYLYREQIGNFTEEETLEFFDCKKDELLTFFLKFKEDRSIPCSLIKNKTIRETIDIDSFIDDDFLINEVSYKKYFLDFFSKRLNEDSLLYKIKRLDNFEEYNDEDILEMYSRFNNSPIIKVKFPKLLNSTLQDLFLSMNGKAYLSIKETRAISDFLQVENKDQLIEDFLNQNSAQDVFNIFIRADSDEFGDVIYDVILACILKGGISISPTNAVLEDFEKRGTPNLFNTIEYQRIFTKKALSWAIKNDSKNVIDILQSTAINKGTYSLIYDFLISNKEYFNDSYSIDTLVRIIKYDSSKIEQIIQDIGEEALFKTRLIQEDSFIDGLSNKMFMKKIEYYLSLKSRAVKEKIKKQNIEDLVPLANKENIDFLLLSVADKNKPLFIQSLKKEGKYFLNERPDIFLDVNFNEEINEDNYKVLLKNDILNYSSDEGIKLLTSAKLFFEKNPKNIFDILDKDDSFYKKIEWDINKLKSVFYEQDSEFKNQYLLKISEYSSIRKPLFRTIMNKKDFSLFFNELVKEGREEELPDLIRDFKKEFLIDFLDENNFKPGYGTDDILSVAKSESKRKKLCELIYKIAINKKISHIFLETEDLRDIFSFIKKEDITMETIVFNNEKFKTKISFNLIDGKGPSILVNKKTGEFEADSEFRKDLGHHLFSFYKELNEIPKVIHGVYSFEKGDFIPNKEVDLDGLNIIKENELKNSLRELMDFGYEGNIKAKLVLLNKVGNYKLVVDFEGNSKIKPQEIKEILKRGREDLGKELQRLIKINPNRTFGFELEIVVEDASRSDVASFLAKKGFETSVFSNYKGTDGNSGFEFKPDQSIDVESIQEIYGESNYYEYDEDDEDNEDNEDNLIEFFGFEIASPILRGREGIETADKFLKLLFKNFTIYTGVEAGCGLHVHHDLGSLKEINNSEILKKYISFQDIILELIDPDRKESAYNSGSSFCSRLVSSHGSFRSNGEKPSAMIHNEYGTLEFRMKEGVSSSKEIIDWIKYTQKVVDAIESSLSDDLRKGGLALDRMNKINSILLLKEKVGYRNKLEKNDLRFIRELLGKSNLMQLRG